MMMMEATLSGRTNNRKFTKRDTPTSDTEPTNKDAHAEYQLRK